MFALGIDSGSSMTKGVLFDGKDVVKKCMIPTSAMPKKSIYQIYETLIPEGECFTVTTGYGRDLLVEADKSLTEITCHARGAAFLYPNVRCLIDIGGQDCKVILLDRDHHVIDFLMNDKCAAGTGRFIEMMMRTLELPQEVLNTGLKEADPVHMNSMCTVFAESEMVSLLAEGKRAEDIALGAIESICRRTVHFARRLSLEEDIYFSGGLAGYPVFQNMLERELNLPILTHELSQYTGALGAAVIGWQKGRKKDR